MKENLKYCSLEFICFDHNLKEALLFFTIKYFIGTSTIKCISCLMKDCLRSWKISSTFYFSFYPLISLILNKWVFVNKNNISTKITRVILLNSFNFVTLYIKCGWLKCIFTNECNSLHKMSHNKIHPQDIYSLVGLRYI